MSAHPPPIPPDQRPKQGGGDLSKADVAGSTGGTPSGNPPNGNLGEQGRSGNIKQNTTNKGLQQDR